MHDAPLIEGFDPTHGLGHAIRHLTGMNSDHVEDQKKLFRLTQEWRRSEWILSLGLH